MWFEAGETSEITGNNQSRRLEISKGAQDADEVPWRRSAPLSPAHGFASAITPLYIASLLEFGAAP